MKILQCLCKITDSLNDNLIHYINYLDFIKGKYLYIKYSSDFMNAVTPTPEKRRK